MHKNHRRKIKQDDPYNWWRSRNQKFKKAWLKWRSKSRRRRDKQILKKTLLEEHAWEDIRTFELPVDWWAID